MAKVLQINTSLTKGVIKEAVDKAMFKIDHGITGDAHAGDWHRQVSMLGIEKSFGWCCPITIPGIIIMYDGLGFQALIAQSMYSVMA